MKDIDVYIIGGFGHVGLPLGITLADARFQVSLFDIDSSKRAMIEEGEMPFIEHGAEPMLKRVIGESLFVSSDISDAAHSRIIVITIGTPVDEYLSPKTRALFELADDLMPHLQSDHCVVLRSTVYPGTSEYLHGYFRDKGHPVHVAFCPERIAQGHAIRELRELPQIVSGFSREAIGCAREIFEKLGVETIEVAPEEAELCKLYLNAWRYIQFAAGNQFSMIANDRGLDYGRIYHAMTHNYERGKAIPRPGFAAGPCLLKDTMQLAAANRSQFLLGHAAMMINEGLPAHIIDRLRADGAKLRGAKVGILGMAFKADIDDTRDALSYKLAKQLRFHGADVIMSDEYVRDHRFVSKEELVALCDIVIIGVPHAAYRTLSVPQGKVVVDLWNALP